jgi:hypothetical protein
MAHGDISHALAVGTSVAHGIPCLFLNPGR